MSDPTDLVAWLTACYDRAEQRTLAVGASLAVHTFAPVKVDLHKDAALSWESKHWFYSSRVVARCAEGFEGFDPPKVVDGTWVEVADHIAAHDPAWRLADIGRKRLILAEHDDQHDCTDPRAWEFPYVGCTTVRLLAAEFADRPGYDAQRWAP